MSGEIEQGLHEKLCAYVLGESEGADRAEVERELLRSPELRAERERLAATIGAVRDALAPAETLSADAHAALGRAVTASSAPGSSVRPSPIAEFPWLRLAAGIGAVGLGWWIFAGSRPERSEVLVARTESAPSVAESVSDAARERKKAQAAFAKGSQGGAFYDSDDEDADLRVAVGMSDSPEAGSIHRLENLGYAGESKPAVAAVPTIERKATDSASAGAMPWPLDTSIPADRSSYHTWRNTAVLGQDSDGSSANAAGGTAIGIGGGAPGAAPTPLAGRELGTGPRKGRAAPEATLAKSEPTLPPSSAAGSYRGPGDSVPASTGGTGPSTPAPSACGPTVAGTDNFFVGDPAPSGPQELAKAASETQLGYRMRAENPTTAHDDEDKVSAESRRQKNWRELSPVEQAGRIELRAEEIYRDCFPRPNERPRDMYFRFWGDNPFEVTQLDRLSTFSVDVDTASYALARRYLHEGKVPEKAQIRTEEFLNYFPSDVEAPRNATFSVHSDLTPSRFSADNARQMLRVVVRAKDVDKFERQPMHLTFVVDVSGSMKEQNRLETVKNALRMLVAQLDGRDSIALVKFSNDANLVLPMTSVIDRTTIEAAIAPLKPEGSTNSNAGLQLGYAQALTSLDPNVVNRVVFLSDGVANVGETDAAKILEGVQSIREKGIFLNTIGVGMNNHNDVLLEQLADEGDGMCNYVDSPKEIQRALVDRFTGAFQPIAKDVKIQVEFDPQQVMRYRLLGYENRAIADADFRNDAVDAGEVGAGHQVTELYEIEPTGRGGEGPMATVRLRWKPIRPAGVTGVQEATEASFEVSTKSYQAFESAPAGYRRAAIVAQFAEILRRSIHARGESLDDLIQEATKLQAQIPNDADFAEFTAMLLRAKDLILRSMPVCDELCQTVDALRSNIYLGSVFHETGRDPRTLEEIEQNRRELEQRLRDVLRKQAESETDVFEKLEGLGYR